MNAVTVMNLIAQTEMKPFTEADYMAFGGCESDNPLIGENGDFLIIIDGNNIEVFEADSDKESYKFEVSAK